ncbi:MAG: ABC transporter permease [Planctomycetota bacterium]|nr:ABC transporter permease [Planctomycetota bacterium]
MIILTIAMLRSFVADRIAALLTLVAPIAFFSLIALFYRHLEATDGFRFEIAVVDDCGSSDARLFVQAMESSAMQRVHVSELRDGEGNNRGMLATVRIPDGFSRVDPHVLVEAASPLPGASDAALQLVNAANARAFAVNVPVLSVQITSLDGMLVRGSAAGIALIFIMFSSASIASRSLGDDALGLQDRLRSLGISAAASTGARIVAISVIAWWQLALTLAWAAAVFHLVPSSVLALACASGVAAVSSAAFFVALAGLCGSRARFLAIAPVITLVLSALSGSMIPRILLPKTIASVGGWLFPAWAIDACSAAIDGRFDMRSIGLLIAISVGSTVVALACARRSMR